MLVAAGDVRIADHLPGEHVGRDGDSPAIHRLVPARRIRIGGIVDDGVRHHVRCAHALPVQAVVAFPNSRNIRPRGLSHEKSEHLVLAVPVRCVANREMAFLPQVVGPDHRAFLDRLVHRARQTVHLGDGDIVQEQLPFPGRHDVRFGHLRHCGRDQQRINRNAEHKCHRFLHHVHLSSSHGARRCAGS